MCRTHHTEGAATSFRFRLWCSGRSRRNRACTPGRAPGRSALPPGAQAATVAVARTGPGLPLRGYVLLHRHPDPPVIGVIKGHDVHFAPDQASVLAPIAHLAAGLSEALEIG